jgi:predicted PurR-regulated permease PerM
MEEKSDQRTKGVRHLKWDARDRRFGKEDYNLLGLNDHLSSQRVRAASERDFMLTASDEGFREFQRRSLWLISIGLAIVFVCYAWRLLILMFAGLLLAILLRTFADWIEAHTRLGPNLSYAVTICGLTLIAGLTALLFIPRIISQVSSLAHILPASIHQARQSLERYAWGLYIVNLIGRSTENLNLTQIAGQVVNAMVAAVVTLVVGFYLGANPGAYHRALLSLVPEEHRRFTTRVISDVIYTLRWWLLGQLVPMAVLGITTMIGLSLLGVKLAFILGLITGLFIFVPYLGTLLSEIPAVLVALADSPKKALSVVVLYLVLHSLEGYVLTPLVQRRTVELLPLLTVLSQVLMLMLAGPLGVAIATPLAAAGLALIKVVYLKQDIRH